MMMRMSTVEQEFFGVLSLMTKDDYLDEEGVLCLIGMLETDEEREKWMDRILDLLEIRDLDQQEMLMEAFKISAQ